MLLRALRAVLFATPLAVLPAALHAALHAVFHAVLIVALLAAPSAHAARDSGDEAERLIITATRMPTPLSRIAGGVTVITAADIARHQYRDLPAALAGVPGLHVARTGVVGAQTSVFVRGAESDHVLVLVDGVEMTDPSSGLFAFADFRIERIERIEIVRGAHSAQYGSEAIGGVIHIITRRGAGEPSLRARAEVGSFGTEDIALEALGAVGALDWSANVSRFVTDGESHTPRRLRGSGSGSGGHERDGYERSAAGLKAGWQITDAARLSLTHTYADFDGEYDGAAGEDPALARSGRERATSLQLEGDYFGGLWQPRWSAASFARQETNRNGAARTAHTDGRRFQAAWRNLFVLGPRLRLLAGAETELEKLRVGDNFSRSARSRALHAQMEWTPADSVSVGAGWRNEDPDDFGSERSHNLSAVFAPRTGLRFHAAFGTGFKAPSLSDRFRDFPAFSFFANPDLRPETSRSREAGFDWQAGAFGLGATWFRNRIRDLIATAPSGQTLVNRNRASIEGLESYLRWRPSDAFGARIDYTLTSAKDGNHQRLLRRPLRKAALDLSWRPRPGTSLNLQWNINGPAADIDRVTFMRVREGGYSTFNLAARHRLHDGVDLLVRAENLLDKRHEPVNGFAGPGAAWHAGLSFQLPD